MKMNLKMSFQSLGRKRMELESDLGLQDLCIEVRLCKVDLVLI